MGSNPTFLWSANPGYARWGRGRLVGEVDADAAEASAFVLGLWDRDLADLARVLHVGAAIGLAVESDDVDDANLVDVLRQEIHLRSDKGRVGVGSISWEERDLDCAPAGQFLVEGRLDGRQIVRRPLWDVEVEPPRSRLHVSSGHGTLEPIPHDSAQCMKRSVGPHQQVAALPVKSTLNCRSGDAASCR